jgi:hypothetical protein
LVLGIGSYSRIVYCDLGKIGETVSLIPSIHRSQESEEQDSAIKNINTISLECYVSGCVIISIRLIFGPYSAVRRWKYWRFADRIAIVSFRVLVS